MKVLIQRVKFAQVSVEDKIIAKIDQGILAYVGLGLTDDQSTVEKMVDKILNYRIFENCSDPDKRGKLDQTVQAISGGLLLVSQFTLLARTNKGARPDFTQAMPPDLARALFDHMVHYARQKYAPVACGQFGADMQVLAQNDGPINLILEI